MSRKSLLIAAGLIIVPVILLFLVSYFIQPLLPAPWNNVLILLGVVVAAVLATLSAITDTLSLAEKLSGAESEGAGDQSTIALGDKAKAIRSDKTELLVAGDVNVNLLSQEATDGLLGALKADKRDDLKQETKAYLAYLINRYQYMDFRGMGMADRVPLKLPLLKMFVPLKAMASLPEGETPEQNRKMSKSSKRLAGRDLTDEELAELGGHQAVNHSLYDLLNLQSGLIVLGDPGAGKTTFLKVLALRLAAGDGEVIGLGGMLPILVPLSAYANALDKRDVPLIEFLADYYEDQNLAQRIDTLLKTALEEGKALVLLDGLDEVKEKRQRLIVVQHVENFFAQHSHKGNKFVLTSRIVGYRELRLQPQEGLKECTLLDFDREDQAAFIDKWSSAVEVAISGDGESARQAAEIERKELLEAVADKASVSNLAANPLLLTILALMKRNGVRLPERRVELYQKYVETLIHSWNLARGLDRRYGQEVDDKETIRLLAPLALWMHEVSPGVGMVKLTALEEQMNSICHSRGFEDPEAAAKQLMADARDHANLLLERGPGTYGFIHLTFQEYLAAVAIALQGQGNSAKIVQLLLPHVADAAWHEVILLTVGYVTIVQGLDSVASEVLLALIEQHDDSVAVTLAGEAILDIGRQGITADCYKTVQSRLLEVMRDSQQVEVKERVKAGATLGRLGDPRDEIVDVQQMRFCYVPAGPFWMGSEVDDPDANDSEKPQHEAQVAHHYWMAQYPISQAQFTQFVAAGGYAKRAFWIEADKHGYWKDGKFRDRVQPNSFGLPFDIGNHPVVGISWYEGLAFTRWLTAVWQEKGWIPEAWQVRLPMEREWEKGARGGWELPTRPLISAIKSGAIGTAVSLNLAPNPLPKRPYPWGDGFDPNKTNAKETEVGTTSALAVFPENKSPYGVMELSGNSYEWCQSLWVENYKNLGSDREDLATNAFRTLKGLGFGAGASLVRCASRLRSYPYFDLWSLGMRVLVSPPLASKKLTQ